MENTDAIVKKPLQEKRIQPFPMMNKRSLLSGRSPVRQFLKNKPRPMGL